MNAKNENILGYAATPDSSECRPPALNPKNSFSNTCVHSVNEYAPSFPPTSIDYKNYPWLNPSASNPVRQDNIDQNAISYLMMGSFQTPPSPVGLPYSGTFVEENCLYCMNRRIFWGSWLLEQLSTVIKMMELVPDTPYVAYNDDDPHFPWVVGVRLHVGNSGGADSDYVFQQSGGDPASWSWNGNQKDSEDTAYGGGDHERVHETGRACILFEQDPFT